MTLEAEALALRIEMLDATGIRAIDIGQWEALARCGLDENPFYAPCYVLAGLNTIDHNSGLRALAVWHRESGALLGLFPIRLKLFPVLRAIAAKNLYQFSGQPLIHRDHADAVIMAWCGAIKSGHVPRRWSFPHLDLSSGFAERLNLLADGQKLQCVPLVIYRRARLNRDAGGFDHHLSSRMPKSRVKDIQRTLRRLGELGILRFERAQEPALVARRIEEFLAIEHAGWKGKSGTSFLSHKAHERFARQAFSGEETSVDSLLLDGRPIALSINMRSGKTLFTPKCAYDENYRKYSPGLVLEYLVVQAFYDSNDCTDMDSSTTADGHIVQDLWNDHKPMGTLVVGPRSWSTDLLTQCHNVSRAMRHKLNSGDRSSAEPLINLIRTGRRRLERLKSDLILSGACFIHTAEHLLPHLA